MRSNLPDTSARNKRTHGTAMSQLRHRWGLFLALGVLAVTLGLAALVMSFQATVYIIKVFMIIASGSEIIVWVGAKT